MQSTGYTGVKAQAMNSREKFLLFVSSYLAALGPDPKNALRLLNARNIAHSLDETLLTGFEEARAYDFVSWYCCDGAKPQWMADFEPLTLEEKAALSFAIVKHGDQKYGQHPYRVHLEDVHATTVEFGLPIEYRVAAFLHDVLEDTKVTLEDLENIFGRPILKLVWAVSGFGPNRKARIEDAHAKMKEYPSAIPLKLCDRIANGRRSKADNPSLLAMYKGEYPSFKTALLPLCAKLQIDCDPLWLELDRVFDSTGT